MRTLTISHITTTQTPNTALLSPSMLPSPVTKSAWHSPVPYLFGGLAAMLGLIAFSLLLLACSYWSAANRLERERRERDIENGEKQSDANEKESNRVFEEKFLVIMAGEQKPTHLATAVSNKASTVEGGNQNFEKGEGAKLESEDKFKGVNDNNQEDDGIEIENSRNGDTQLQ